MKRNSVLVCAAHFYPHLGGHEKFIFELYSRLSDDFEVDVLVSDILDNPSFESIKGINVYRLDSWGLLGGMYPFPKLTYKNFKLIRKMINKRHLFINTHTRFFTISLVGLILSKIKKTNLIHTEHGSGAVVHDNFIVKTLSNMYDQIIGRIIVKSSIFTIGISESTKIFLEKLGSTKTYVIHNSVDTDFFSQKSINGNIEINFEENITVITYVGRLIFSKGVQDLIEVFLNLKKDYSVKLIIVGDGIYKNNLINIAKKDQDVLFLGEREDIPDILGITNILVNPSYSEGLPTSLLEAASMGVPIVATDVGATSELFIDEMGYLFESHDLNSLENYLKTIMDKKAKVDPKKSRNYVIENYSWSKNSLNFLELLKGSGLI